VQPFLPEHRPLQSGVVQPVKVLDLLYADDIAVLAPERQQLQIALDVICKWCMDFGMEVSVGSGKTEAMAFPVPGVVLGPRCACDGCVLVNGKPVSKPPDANLPKLYADISPTETREVSWTTQYRYLGYLMNPELCTCAAAMKTVTNLRRLWSQYFTSNAQLLRYASPTLALQLVKSIILTSSGYLLDIIRPSNPVMEELNRLIFTAGKWACRLSSRTPQVIPLAETRALLAEQCVLRDRVRHMCQMTHPHPAAYSSLARDVYRLLVYELRYVYSQRLSTGAGTQLVSATPPREASWVDVTARLMQEYIRQLGVTPYNLDLTCSPVDVGRDIPPARRTPYLHVSAAAASHARRVAVTLWQRRAARDAVEVPLRPGIRPGRTALETASYLYGGYTQSVSGYELGFWPGITSISFHGPGCSGGVISLVSHFVPNKYLRVLQLMKLGRMGLFMYPLLPSHLRYRGSTTGGTVDNTTYFQRWRVLAYGHGQCMVCNRPGLLNPWHVLLECSNAAVSTARLGALRTLPALIRLLCIQYTKARLRSPPALQGRDPGVCISPACPTAAELERRAEAMDWQSDDGQFCLFFLLLAHTWDTWRVREVPFVRDAIGVPSLDSPLCVLLADMFESTRAQNHYLRIASHRWVMWAGKWVFAMCSAWSKAFALTPQAQALISGATQSQNAGISAAFPATMNSTTSGSNTNGVASGTSGVNGN
jgi:hypothetical protein